MVYVIVTMRFVMWFCFAYFVAFFLLLLLLPSSRFFAKIFGIDKKSAARKLRLFMAFRCSQTLSLGLCFARRICC